MNSTALLYDTKFLQHETGWTHPEKPKRLTAIYKKIEKSAYFKDLLLIKPDYPDIKYIEEIHSKEYLKHAEKTITGGMLYLDSRDTRVCKKSFDVAMLAAGRCLKMCDAVMKNSVKNGFCLVRPPGHHAERGHAAGFCILNNIAIAAKYIQILYKIKRIAIVDWDVHHGNGTQHSFEESDKVMYISIHQFPHYPGTGSKNETGKGRGSGYNINIPMAAGSDDADYMKAFNEKIIPALNWFKPEVILISAGFDAHFNDQLSAINLSTDIYKEFTLRLMEVASEFSKNRIIAFLEGGYNLSALSNSIDIVMDTLSRV